MIGLDTNVICRYLLGDDPEQAKLAARIIEGAIERKTHCFLSKIVLCELVWVLESCTSMTRSEIATHMDRILHADHLLVEDRQAVRWSLSGYRRGKGDFADYLIHRSNLAGGCSKTVTFDLDLRGTPGIEILGR